LRENDDSFHGRAQSASTIRASHLRIGIATIRTAHIQNRSHSHPPMAWIEHHDYPDTATMVAALTDTLHAACASGIAARGSALLALAGGRTPFPIYRALAQRSGIDWSKVTAMPGDDRCVAHDHAASNLAGLRSAFADAPGMRIAALTAVDGDAARSLIEARDMLARHREDFDAVLLGMGEDAHTASLFPGAKALAEAMAADAREDAFAIVPDPLPPEAPFARITLGYARLLRARALHLVVTGARKREVLRDALIESDPLRAPISAFLHARECTLHIHWSP
jgi:6-phosphogluconolactonase